MAGPAWISKVRAGPAGVRRAGGRVGGAGWAEAVRERGPRRAQTVRVALRPDGRASGGAKVTAGPGCPRERRAGAGPASGARAGVGGWPG